MHKELNYIGENWSNTTERLLRNTCIHVSLKDDNSAIYYQQNYGMLPRMIENNKSIYILVHETIKVPCWVISMIT